MKDEPSILPPEPLKKPGKEDDDEAPEREEPRKVREPETPGPKVDEPPRPQSGRS